MIGISKSLLVQPHAYIGDVTGRPLDYGMVYIGEPDKDPEFNPIIVFSDEELTKPIAQPIRTKGGFMYDKGDIINVYAGQDEYSVKVLDNYGRQVFYKPLMSKHIVNTDESIVSKSKFEGAFERTQSDINAETVDLLRFVSKEDAEDIKNRVSNLDVSDALAKAVATGKRVIISQAGTYKFKAGYDGTTDFDVKATTEGVIFDFDGSTAAYPISNSGSVTLLNNKFTAPDAKDISVEFESVDGLEVGDWLCFYCPTDYSYSSWRANYRAGEWVKIISIDDNTVYFERPFTDSLKGLHLDLYKLNSVVCKLEGMTLKRHDGGVGIVKFALSSNAKGTNVTADTTTNSIILYDRCVKPVTRGVQGKNKGRGTDDYFISIGNCQSARIYDADVYARRHAVALGGGNDVCSVPITDFRCYNSVLNADPNALSGAADMHGNIRDSSYENCIVYAGTNIGGGDNCWYNNCEIYPDAIGRIGFTRELVGGSCGWRNSKVHLKGSPRASSRGIIDVGGSSSGITDAAKKDIYISVLDTKILTASKLDENIGETFVKINVKGCQHNVNVEVNRLTSLCEMPKVYTPLYISGFPADASQGTPDTVIKSKGIIVDNLTNIKATTLFATADRGVGRYDDESIPMRMMTQSGVCTGAVNVNDVEVLPDNADYDIAYPREPKLLGHFYAVGDNSPYNSIGGKQGFNLFPIIQKNRIRAKIALPAGEAFTEADTYKLNWTVGINEV